MRLRGAWPVCPTCEPSPAGLTVYLAGMGRILTVLGMTPGSWRPSLAYL